MISFSWWNRLPRRTSAGPLSSVIDKSQLKVANKSSRRPHTSAKENMVWIRSPYPDPDSGPGLPPKFNGNFLVHGYICDKIFIKIRSLSPGI